jgi:uncharacterized protein
MASERERIIPEILLLFAVFFLPGYLFPSTMARPDFNLPAFHLRYATAAIPQILLLLFLMQGMEGGTARFGAGKPRRIDIPAAVAIAVVLVGVMAAIEIPLSLLGESARRMLKPEGAFGLPGPAMLPLSFVTCMVTGYREELFFRSYLITRLDDLGSSAWASVTVSSLVFAAGHAYEGAAGIVMVAVIGAILAASFRERRSVHAVAVAHGLYDFAVLLLSSSIT